MTRTRTVIMACTLLSVFALGACSGDDPQPKISPPSTSSTSPGGVSTPPTTVDPETEFVARYFASIGEATTTGQTDKFQAMSSSDCVNCRTLAINIASAFQGRSHVDGASWVVSKSQRAGRRAEGNIWNVDVATARERWYDGSGKLIKIVRASTQKFAVIVNGDGGSFQVVDLRLR